MSNHPYLLSGRRLCRWMLSVAAAVGVIGTLQWAVAEGPRVMPEGKLPADARLGPLKDLDGYFPFTPSDSPEAWAKRAQQVRQQILVANGLWPMPERSPPNAVVHGKVERDSFTVERVYLESYPGFHITGSLFRPVGKSGPFPIVLCPHGHWPNGRFYDRGEKEILNDLVNGAERFEVGGRYPLQARCATLARMGCVVFHYDMIGYADSRQLSFELAHRFAKQRPDKNDPNSFGLFSPPAEARLQSIMGLQTYNSIRALDWALELPDVDKDRVAVTGASGGGTQTFLLAAIDPRVTVAFPAVMVSTAMQGGCTCENCTYLRVGTGNIEFAAMFAPKPIGMTAADDWTKEIATKGLPELKKHFAMMGVPDNVMAAPLIQFPHNYNYVSRAVMYKWLNKHLKLGHPEPVVEQDFVPLTESELTVYDDQHPRPEGGDAFELKLTKTIADLSDKQLAEMKTSDPERYRQTLAGGWNVLIGRGLPEKGTIEFEKIGEDDAGKHYEFTGLLRNPARGEEAPLLFLHPHDWNSEVVIWIDEQGKSGLYGSDGTPKAEVLKLVQAGYAVAGIDLLYQGEFLADGKPLAETRRVSNPREFHGFTYGYNHPLFSQRVHDVLSLVSFVRNHKNQPKQVHLIGLNSAGPLCAAAALQAGKSVDKVVVDGRFRFGEARSLQDPNFLPGAVKYGDVPALLELISPDHKLRVLEEKVTPADAAAAIVGKN
ncbi:MAG: acetylxylan esterase [Pirellulales bacterium]